MKNGLFVINFSFSCKAQAVNASFSSVQFYVLFLAPAAPPRKKKYWLQVRRLGLRPTSAALVAVEYVCSLSLSSVRWKFANQLTELGIENLK